MIKTAAMFAGILAIAVLLYSPAQPVNLGPGKGAFIVNDLCVRVHPSAQAYLEKGLFFFPRSMGYWVSLTHRSTVVGPYQWGWVRVPYEAWKDLNVGDGYGGDVFRRR